jgi:hypothetical protein
MPPQCMDFKGFNKILRFDGFKQYRYKLFKADLIRASTLMSTVVVLRI